MSLSVYLFFSYVVVPNLRKWHLIIYYPIPSRWNNSISDFLTTEATVMPMNIRQCLFSSWPHVPVSLGRLLCHSAARLAPCQQSLTDSTKRQLLSGQRLQHRMLLKRLAMQFSSLTVMPMMLACVPNESIMMFVQSRLHCKTVTVHSSYSCRY